MQTSDQTMQEKQESLQKQRDQENKNRGRKVVAYSGYLTPKNKAALKNNGKKPPRKKVALGKRTP